jgi:hypothetical protein
MGVKVIVRTALVAVSLWALTGAVLAQEPVGCDKFKWPLDKERAMLSAADVATASSGASVAQLPVALAVSLVPFADAKLPVAPERAPKSPTSFAGFVMLPAPPPGGVYKVSLSSEAWIDAVQDGHIVKSTAFSGATGCEGIRKSVKFDLAAEPFALQFSGVPAASISIAVTRD